MEICIVFGVVIVGYIALYLLECMIIRNTNKDEEHYITYGKRCVKRHDWVVDEKSNTLICCKCGYKAGSTNHGE